MLQDGKIIIDCKTDIIQKEEFDFTWYPFDAHTFKVPFVSGKRIRIVVKIPECYDISKFMNAMIFIPFSEWNTSVWTFRNTWGASRETNMFITGWTVSAKYHKPVKTQLPLPATGFLGKASINTMKDL